MDRHVKESNKSSMSGKASKITSSQPHHALRCELIYVTPLNSCLTGFYEKNLTMSTLRFAGPFSIVQKNIYTGQCFIPTYWPLQPVHPKKKILKKINKPTSSNLRICIKGFTNRSVILYDTNPTHCHSLLRCEIPQKFDHTLSLSHFIWGFPKMVVPNNHGFSY